MLRRAAITSGLSGRAASVGASTTCHQLSADGHDGKGQDEVHRQPPGMDGDHGPRPSCSAATADRWLMASSSPMMMKLASRLDPP